MTSPTTTKVLVYHHRHNATNPIVPNGLAVMTTSELETILANNPTLQRTSKPIARALSVDVYEHDLLTEEQQVQFASKPNYNQNVAGVAVPLKVFVGKLLGSREFEELVILSERR